MLPVYSVLIPVYDEDNMKAQIARSLAALSEDRKHMCLIYLITLPAYWLLITPATLIALYRMARGQMGWMKTPHRPFGRKS